MRSIYRFRALLLSSLQKPLSGFYPPTCNDLNPNPGALKSMLLASLEV
jgi:hypothetical protein